MVLSFSFVLVAFNDANTPANATEAVPYAMHIRIRIQSIAILRSLRKHLHRCTYLNIIVECTVAIAIFVDQMESIRVAKIFELN